MLPVVGSWTKGACRAVNVLPQGVAEGDFEHIEAAVRETERGRWFLDEYERRARTAEGARVAKAIERLEERAALRQARDDETREHFRRVVSLLAALVDSLTDRNEEPAIERPGANAVAAPQGEVDARLEGLALVDALSVADKLRLFR